MFPATMPSPGGMRAAVAPSVSGSAGPGLPPGPQAPRGSAGEAGAGARPIFANAIDPARQSPLAERLRDREDLENRARLERARDAPAGPPPAFDETVLERQARLALDPVELTSSEKPAKAADQHDAPLEDSDHPGSPKPTTVEARAESGFAETREMTERQPPSVDLRG